MASDFFLLLAITAKGITMLSKVNDLRVFSAYKKQFSDKFGLKDSDFLINAKTKWATFETEFELDGVKYHPFLKYENKNANTPKIIDISLNPDEGLLKDIDYSSAYVESSKPSEVSIHNVIEMCKNMAYEMKLIEECVKDWLENPELSRYDFPICSYDSFIRDYCQNGRISRQGINGQVDEDNKIFYDESMKLIQLLNTFPSIYSPGRKDEVLANSYHLKHLLERMTPSGYFSNGSVIAVLPWFVRDRYSMSESNENGIMNISGPNCDIVIPKQLNYILEAIYKNLKETK